MRHTPCPFKVGDLVTLVNADKIDFPGQNGCPALGETIRITAIKNDLYLEWDGVEKCPGGGLSWYCFKPADQ